MLFARHVIGFTAWGTAVHLKADNHIHVRPEVVVPWTTQSSSSTAESLRGRRAVSRHGCRRRSRRSLP